MKNAIELSIKSSSLNYTCQFYVVFSLQLKLKILQICALSYILWVLHEHNLLFQGFQKGKAIMKKPWNLIQLSITTSFAPGWMEMLQLLVVVAIVPAPVVMLLQFVGGSWP